MSGKAVKAETHSVSKALSSALPEFQFFFWLSRGADDARKRNLAGARGGGSIQYGQIYLLIGIPIRLSLQPPQKDLQIP